MTQQAQSKDDKVAHHCTIAVVALIVGLFFFGIICGPIAAYNGNKATENGSETAGPVLTWLGVAETVISAIVLAAIIF